MSTPKKTYLFYQKKVEKKKFKDVNPPQTVQKSLKLVLVHTNVFLKTLQVQASKLDHSAVILHIILLSWPCIFILQFWFVSADLPTERSRGRRQRKRPPAQRTRGGPGTAGTQPSRPSPCQKVARWSQSPLCTSNYLWTFQKAVGGRSSFGTDNEAYNSKYGNSYSSSYSVCNKIKALTFGSV